MAKMSKKQKEEFDELCNYVKSNILQYYRDWETDRKSVV